LYDEDTLLQSCYENSLKLAVENGIETIAFPSISTGVYRFPIERAAKIAVRTVKNFVEENEQLKEVIFCVFSDKDYEVYESVFKEFL